MKRLFLAAAVMVLVGAPAIVNAQAVASSAAPAQAPAQPYYSTSESTVGELLDNPETKAILQKEIPSVVNNDQISMAAGMTLRGLQQYASDVLTDEKLAEIDTLLKAVPAPKS